MKTYLILGVLLLLISAPISPESQEAQVAKLEAKIKQLEKTIGRAEKMVNKLEKQLTEQQKENRRLLTLCRKAGIDTKQTIENDEPFIPRIILDELAIGKIGRFEYPPNVRIQHGRNKYSFQVQQIIDEDEMLVKLFGKLIWIDGLATTGIVDDQYIILDQIFFISETRTYETVNGGSKTVFVAKFVLEPFIPAPE